MKVRKRDGRLVNFNELKIINAIKLASENTKSDNKITDKQLKNTVSFVKSSFEEKDKDVVDVDEIHDLVEKSLRKENKDVAKSYIEYRKNRELDRFKNLDITKKIFEKLNATNVVNQNANLDEFSFGGRKGEADSVLLKELALNYLISPKFTKNHNNNRIYIHDLDSYFVGMHNCLSLPIDDLLKNGMKTRQVFIRPANSLSTAMQLVAVAIQLQSLQQFGGVAVTHIDWTMIPYIRKSFFKHYNEGLKFIKNKKSIIQSNVENISILDKKIYKNKKVWNYAYEMIKKEIHQSVEGLLHNLNSLQSRSGNQLPFSSINYGTCTLEEGRLLTKEILECTIGGVGNHATSIFPCQIFQLMNGVNTKEGEPNYDLFKLAIKCTSKRLYPNYVNCDWSNDQGYNKDDPRTYPSTMGCLGGKEHLYIKVNNEVLDVSIKEFFEMCRSNNFYGRKAQIFFNKNENNVGLKVKIDRNRPFEHKSGVYKITHIPTDTTYIGSTSDVRRRFNEHRNNIAKHGGLDGGINYEDNSLKNYKFEVVEYCENYKELENKYIETIPNINYKGTSQQYYKVSNAVKSQDVNTVKPNLEIIYEPQEFINLEDKDIKVLDIDGRWTKIRHVFRNTPNSSPLMMHIYYKEYNHIYEIDATCDHPFFNGNGFTKAEDLKIGDYLYRADDLPLEIINITWTTMKVESFDIGTESGTFVGSDIKMHNCRTYSSTDINAESEELSHLKDGRGNIAPATIVLPTIAMESKKKMKDKIDEEKLIELFMKNLDDAITDCRDELIERFNYICSQNPKSASFMYENETFYGYKKDEGIYSALKHGTLAIGQIGLAETLQILIGTDQCTDKGMKLAKKIESLFKQRCAEFKHDYKLNFGVYYTPAEGLSKNSFDKFVKKYGLIENVTAYKDKDGKLQPRGYFTNSIHVPVWKEVSPFEKIDIESQLTNYSSAGCITYVEIGDNASNNLKALEDIILYAKKKDIPYFALNLPLSHCTKCGCEENIGFDECCPKCGADKSEIEHLARVTGYLSTDYTHFNKGKQMEVKDRFVHVNKLTTWKKK